MNINAGRYWDKAWSLVEGCSPVSGGCDNCWSASMTHRFKKGLTNNSKIFSAVKGKFNGEIIIREDRLGLPLKTKKPTVWSVWNDLFHEDVPMEFIYEVYETMYHCQQHTFLILTKRIKRLSEIYPKFLPQHPENQKYYKHVWHGVSIENQQAVGERIPHLLKIPGKKFLSIEPMLGEINLVPHLFPYIPSVLGEHYSHKPTIDQVICGGETGSKARPCHLGWVRSLRDQCKAAGVPFFLKKIDLGDCWPLNTKEEIKELRWSRILDGRTHDELVWRKK